MFAKILLAVDCWPESRAAVSAAREIALASRGQVLVLHVRERQHARATVLEPGPPGDAEEQVECTVYQLARLGIPTRGILRSVMVGRVPHEIAHVATEEEMDLIVIGSRGLSCLGALFAGSVGHRLIRLADRPVLIAHAPSKECRGIHKHRHAISHPAA